MEHVKNFDSEICQKMDDYIKMVNALQNKQIPASEKPESYLKPLKEEGFIEFLIKIGEFCKPNLKECPTIEMNIPENDIDLKIALIQLKICIIPRLIDFWKQIFELDDTQLHEYFAVYLKSIQIAFGKFEGSNFLNKKFIISQLYCSSRPLIDYDLRDSGNIDQVFNCWNYHFSANSENYLALEEIDVDQELINDVQEVQNFITKILETKTMKYVLGKVLNAIEFRDLIEDCIEILRNVKVIFVKNVGFNGMVGINCVYLNVKFNYLLKHLPNEDDKERKEKTNKKLCKIAGTLLHEDIHYLIRMLKKNYLLTTPKQKKTFFEIGFSHFSGHYLS